MGEVRLIDADAKIMAQLYDDEHEDWVQKEMTVADYLSFADTAIPYVDAVPVVRCRECRWSYTDENTLVCGFRGLFVREEYFCADGERKDDE